MVIYHEMTIGEFIKSALQRKKMKQDQLAERLSITPAQISRIVNDKRGTDIETYLAIADILSVDKFLMLKILAGDLLPPNSNKDEQWIGEVNLILPQIPEKQRSVISKILDAFIEK